MRVLITGGKGQLGRALQAALAGHEMAALGHADLGITGAEAVQRAIAAARPDVLIHCAAWTDTTGCERDPGRALAVNGDGAGNVARACAAAGAAMIYVSSNEVFGGDKNEPYTEDDEPGPINHYGRSKLEGERLVRSALERHYIVRTAWLYGAGRVSFPEKVLQMAAKTGRLKGVADEIASPTWTADLAGGIAALIADAAWGTYHLTNSGYCSRLEWIEEVLRIRGLAGVGVERSTQEEFGAPYRKPVFSALSLEKARRLGIEMPQWRDALERYLRGGA